MKRLFYIVLLLSLAALPATADDFDDLKKLTAELYQLRFHAQKQANDAKRNFETLNIQRNAIMQRLENLRKQLLDAQQRLDTAQTHIADLQIKVADAQKRMDTLAAVINGFMSQLEALSPSLPIPQEQLIQSTLTQVKALDMSVPRNVLKRLTMLLDCSRQLRDHADDIQRTTAILSFDDGNRREFAIAYLGFAVAYATSPDHTAAAIGTPSPNGWNWRLVPEHLPLIAKLFDVLDNQKPAAMLQLPFLRPNANLP